MPKLTKALTIDNLSFKFSGNSELFFDNLRLDLDPGTITILQGSNGIGKSTLFRLLAGKLNYGEEISGTVVINQQQLFINNNAAYTKFMQHHIRVVQQNVLTMLADNFTGKQNLQAANLPHFPSLLPMPGYKVPHELLQQFNIDLDKPVSLLSGGQKQILAILMVLQKEVPILLLDEPTAALDPYNTQIVMQFLQKLIRLKPIAILIINHDRELLKEYASQGYFELVQQSGKRILKKY